MKRIQMKLLGGLLFCSSVMLAQESVLTAGGDASSSTGSISYSIGQTFYTTASSGVGSSATGVQQPYEFYTGIDHIKKIRLSTKVFPNPTNSIVNLIVEETRIRSLEYQLFDASGKLLLLKEVVEETTIIPMQDLVPAMYFLKLSQDQQIVKTFTIIKNQ